jgi:hypothetical protein
VNMGRLWSDPVAALTGKSLCNFQLELSLSLPIALPGLPVFPDLDFPPALPAINLFCPLDDAPEEPLGA